METVAGPGGRDEGVEHERVKRGSSFNCLERGARGRFALCRKKKKNCVRTELLNEL